MANIKQTKDETLATINGAISVLQKYPELSEANTELSYNISTNPFEYLMDVFKQTSGYDKLIKIIAKFISYELPVLESSVKAILIAKMKDIISCSVNPFFTEEILRDGIVFNAEEIDLIDMFRYSPYDEIGRYFYFDTDSKAEQGKIIRDEQGKVISLPKIKLLPDVNDLVKSDDMNALIWFMINKANRRYVWKPKKYRKDAEFRDDYPSGSNEKLRKEDGIVTFEFSERSQNVRDAYGKAYRLQTPYNNCLHVFIGDTREKNTRLINELARNESLLYTEDRNIILYSSKIENKYFKMDEIRRMKIDLENAFAECSIDEGEYLRQMKKLTDRERRVQSEIDALIRQKERAYEAKRRFQYLIGDIKYQLEETRDQFFPFLDSDRNRNYYYGKSLIEFNIDYIASLSLFDEKSLAARLLDSLTSCLTVDLGFSYKRMLIRSEVRKMVTMINESDDITVSDCFFTFTNDDYDRMSRQAELRKAGLLTFNGDETGAVRIDAQDILSRLNEINGNSNRETVQSIIEGAITDLSREITDTKCIVSDEVKFGLQMNFIENLLSNLAYVIVSSVLSPKVYLLMLINLKIIGRETNFDLEGFIGQYKQLIVDLIRSIRDQILNYLLNEIMIIIGSLVEELAIRLSVEQARYYARLIKRLLDCFRASRGESDFSIDGVDYADILPDEQQEPKNNEC